MNKLLKCPDMKDYWVCFSNILENTFPILSHLFHTLYLILFDRIHITMAANKKAFDMQIKLLMIGDSGR